MDTDYIISKDADDGTQVFWQGGPWWSEFREDAKGITEAEARKHEDGFNNAGCHRVAVVGRGKG